MKPKTSKIGAEEAPEENAAQRFTKKLVTLRKSRWINGWKVAAEQFPGSTNLSAEKLIGISGITSRAMGALETGSCFASGSRSIIKNCRRNLDILLDAMHASTADRDDILKSFEEAVEEMELNGAKQASVEEPQPFAPRVSKSSGHRRA